ncbi:MAG TPA: arylamine N-acetyltransferase [Thermoanaerobaculia bacterium]|jgi:N-hydroxyarylamine O-acetyltransferase|nr:arylamine N-acetyltransferase [Thermoanaerobaculia bacterium]
MPSVDLDAYLARIAYSGPREATLSTLTALHTAHVIAIPFENLDILLGRGIDLDLAVLERKLVAGRRGGYCFEQNTLFRAALERLGFRVSSLAARVQVGATAVRPRTHMLLSVDVEGEVWIADVGFGGGGLVVPVPLVEGRETWLGGLGGLGHRLRREGEIWVLEGSSEGAWGDFYAFTLEAQHPADFVMANHFTSTFPSSPFVNNLTVQRSWPEGWLVLRNRDLTLRESGVTTSDTIRDPDHLLEVLRDRFGLAFPAGTRFTRSEFSDGTHG